MLKKIPSILGMIILLAGVTSFQVSANEFSTFQVSDLFPNLSYGDNLIPQRSDTVSVKKEIGYDESKDPALRKGTENWEEPQGSFFTIPAAVVGLIFMILLFNRHN
jgi:hypothetical protein